MKVTKVTIDYQDQKTNALIFLPEVGPETSTILPVLAIFTHGYTSDKSSVLNWPIRLAEAGISAILFDLPGHYLGNYSEVGDFEHFKNHGHELFLSAFIKLKEAFLDEFPLYEHMLEKNELKLVLGGHSLGAMLSIKALQLPQFSDFEKLSISVGLGMAPKNVVHIFETPIFKSTLKVREQFVSPALKMENVFPWIKKEKDDFGVSGETIHLITGADDLVVGEDGMERFAESLIAKNNTVTMDRPAKLPHHEPQMAAAHVKKYLKKINWI